MSNTLLHLVILAIFAVVVVVLFTKIKPRRPPTHRVPVTGPIETTLRLIQRTIKDVWTI